MELKAQSATTGDNAGFSAMDRSVNYKGGLKMNAEKENLVMEFFKSKDARFTAACEKAGIPETRRQASKWLMKKGKAFKQKNGSLTT
jgi:hypothetical protein